MPGPGGAALAATFQAVSVASPRASPPPKQIGGSPPKSVFTCSVCDKSYPTKNSLARHAHNHRARPLHHCDICGVEFRRRDILLRHHKIHTTGAPAEPTSIQPAAAEPRKRRRCHTACIHCRAARSKCDGENPCMPCSRIGKVCKYQEGSMRLSRRPVCQQLNQANPTETDIQDAPGQLPAIDTDPPQWQTPPPDRLQFSAGLSFPNNYSHPFAPDTSTMAQRTTLGTIPVSADFPTPIPPAPGMESIDFDPSMILSLTELPDWQWMHQNQFLRNDPSLMWVSQPLDTTTSFVVGSTTPTNLAIGSQTHDLGRSRVDLYHSHPHLIEQTHQQAIYHTPAVSANVERGADMALHFQQHPVGLGGPMQPSPTLSHSPFASTPDQNYDPLAANRFQLQGHVSESVFQERAQAHTQTHYPAPISQNDDRSTAVPMQVKQTAATLPAVTPADSEEGSPNAKKPLAETATPDPNPVASVEMPRLSQAEVVDKMIEYAKFDGLEHAPFPPSNKHTAFWRSMSANIDTAFMIGKGLDSTQLTIERYINHYFEHFHPLWVIVLLPPEWNPMVHLRPLLYLTVASIGAMYDNPASAVFGIMLHEKIRACLTINQLEFADAEKEPLWLLQSLALTQLATLYFGHRRAFSAAQLIGCMLISHARRLRLFSVQSYRTSHLEAIERCKRPKIRDHLWLLLQTKVRLAFSIFRSDGYMSALMNTRPLMSATEMEADIAMYVFNPLKLTDMASSIDRALAGLRNVESMPPVHVLSDTVRISMDRRERLPSDLGPGEHEILLFGLQGHVWEYCHDPGAVTRLLSSSGVFKQPSGPFGEYDLDTSGMSYDMGDMTDINDHVPQEYMTFRRMEDLRSDACRLASALKQWGASFVKCGRSFPPSQSPAPARPVLVTSLLLYHLTFVRMHAPVEFLHKLSYSLDKVDEMHTGSTSGAGGVQSSSSAAAATPDTTSLLRGLYAWAQQPHAETAVRHAIQIWRLIRAELARPEDQRVRLNLMSFVGLHHGGVVVWAYALTRESGQSNFFLPIADSLARDAGSGINSVLKNCPYRRTQGRGLDILSGPVLGKRGRGGHGAGGDGRLVDGGGAGGSSDSAAAVLPSFPDRPGGGNEAGVPLCREEIPTLLSSFAALYEHISPTWSLKSTFAEAAARLGRREPPSLRPEEERSWRQKAEWLHQRRPGGPVDG